MQPSHTSPIRIIAMLALIAAVAAGCTKKDGDKSFEKRDTPSAETETPAEETPPAAPASNKEICQKFRKDGPQPKTDDGNISFSEAPPLLIGEKDTFTVTINTNKGVITARIDASLGHMAANNFIFLTCSGFYQNVPIHRVVEGFMFQGGDPTGTGTGDAGYSIDDDAVTQDYTRGMLAMANSGPNTGSSQFFVMFKDYPLPPNYAQFGEVTDGLDAVDAIEGVEVATSPSGEQSDPVEELTIKSIELV